jgi:prolyl oligopeptidase
VYFHKVGTAQKDDELVYEDAAHPQRFNTVDVTEDERFAILTVSDRGTGKKGNAVFVRDLTKKVKTCPLIPEITDDEHNVIDNVATRSWCTPTTARPTAAWCESTRASLTRRTGW